MLNTVVGIGVKVISTGTGIGVRCYAKEACKKVAPVVTTRAGEIAVKVGNEVVPAIAGGIAKEYVETKAKETIADVKAIKTMINEKRSEKEEESEKKLIEEKSEE